MCDNASCKSTAAPDVGSRRRRLWDMPTNCHCPVVGVCLPLALLRRLVDKVTATPVQGDDYDVHVLAVHECANRNRLSELLQKTLDERFAVVVQQFRAARDEAGVERLWRQAVERGDVAGPFWAALTHPRCDLRMVEAIVRDMHMIQHQSGARAHVDLDRFAALQKQNRALEAELAQARDKGARAVDAKARELARAAGEASQLRAELAQRDAAIDGLRRDLDALQAALPDLRDRERLLRRVAELEAREQALADKMAQLRQRLTHARQEAGAGVQVVGPQGPQAPAAAAPMPVTVRPLLNLTDKNVLCVGGRSGNVPNYREVLEKEGARFMHHDGGLEQAAELLDTSLAAADLVICQTGCISHQAYWRVKDFCKRTGKRCLFVDNPSTSSLSSCLRNAAPVGEDVA